MRRISTSAAAVGMLLLSISAAADEPPPTGSGRARASAEAGSGSLVEQGLTLYKARDYRRAAEKFLQAYATDQDVNLLFNVARCYESLGDTAGAIEKYELYLQAPNIDANGKQRAEAALRNLRAGKVDKQPPSDRSADIVSDKVSEKPTPATTQPNSGDTKALVGWIVTAALATGTVLTGVLAVNSAGQLSDARSVYPGDGANMDSLSSKTLAFSITADALGAATIVMGGLSLYWTIKGSSSRSEIKAGVGATGLKVTGTF